VTLVQSAHSVPALTTTILADQPMRSHHSAHFNLCPFRPRACHAPSACSERVPHGRDLNEVTAKCNHNTVLSLHLLSEPYPTSPETAYPYRVAKQLVDFQVLRSHLRRVVQATHSLSSCSFCKVIKVVCATCEKELGSPIETSSGQDETDLSLQAGPPNMAFIFTGNQSVQ